MKMKEIMLRIYFRIVYGKMYARVVGTEVDGTVVSEIEYIGRKEKIVGYWAYGSFDLDCPFKGQFEVPTKVDKPVPYGTLKDVGF